MPVARMTSKGQVTVPKSVREALGLCPGDGLNFDLRDGQALVSKQGEIGDLAGALPLPASARGRSWEGLRQEALRAWALDSEERGRSAG